jgi:hypothetical protein
VVFVNGIQKVYDCHNIMTLERFHPLRDEVFFKTVTADSVTLSFCSPSAQPLGWSHQTAEG